MTNNSTIVTKVAGKTSDFVLDREVYLQNAHKELSDEDFYKQITKNPSNLDCSFLTVLNTINTSNYLPTNTLKLFSHKDPKYARFLFVTKKRLHSDPGWLVISNCDYSKETFHYF